MRAVEGLQEAVLCRFFIKMRQLVAVIFGVLCVAIATTSGQVLGSDDPGEVEPGDSTPENPFDGNACEKSENVPVCTDCTKITVCLNKKALPAKSCPAEAPYCISSLDSGAYCSGQPDPERQQCQDKFQCTSEGYFPGELTSWCVSGTIMNPYELQQIPTTATTTTCATPR